MVLQLVFVHVKFGIAEVNTCQAGVVKDDLFDVVGMVGSIELIVPHHNLDQPLVLLDTVHDVLEVHLKLVA